MPALLSGDPIDTVGNNKATLVIEDSGRQFERDPAMLPLVLFVLGSVPFVAHIVYT